MKLKTIEAARTRSQAALSGGAGPSGAAGPSTNDPALQPSPAVAPAQEADAGMAAGERACPTRADGAMPLFQHRVTITQCQSKQRGMYHKCYSCAHANARR